MHFQNPCALPGANQPLTTYRIIYTLLVQGQEYPRVISLRAKSKVQAKRKLVKRINREDGIRLRIESIE